MGKLLVDVGVLTATKQIANAKAQKIIDGFVAAQGGPSNGTEQERLDWYIQRIPEYTHDIYRRYKRATALAAAEVADATTTETWE